MADCSGDSSVVARSTRRNNRMHLVFPRRISAHCSIGHFNPAHLEFLRPAVASLRHQTAPLSSSGGVSRRGLAFTRSNPEPAGPRPCESIGAVNLAELGLVKELRRRLVSATRRRPGCPADQVRVYQLYRTMSHDDITRLSVQDLSDTFRCAVAVTPQSIEGYCTLLELIKYVELTRTVPPWMWREILRYAACVAHSAAESVPLMSMADVNGQLLATKEHVRAHLLLRDMNPGGRIVAGWTKAAARQLWWDQRMLALKSKDHWGLLLALTADRLRQNTEWADRSSLGLQLERTSETPSPSSWPGKRSTWIDKVVHSLASNKRRDALLAILPELLFRLRRDCGCIIGERSKCILLEDLIGGLQPHEHLAAAVIGFDQLVPHRLSSQQQKFAATIAIRLRTHIRQEMRRARTRSDGSVDQEHLRLAFTRISDATSKDRTSDMSERRSLSDTLTRMSSSVRRTVAAKKPLNLANPIEPRSVNFTEVLHGLNKVSMASSSNPSKVQALAGAIDLIQHWDLALASSATSGKHLTQDQAAFTEIVKARLLSYQVPVDAASAKSNTPIDIVHMIVEKMKSRDKPPDAMFMSAVLSMLDKLGSADDLDCIMASLMDQLMPLYSSHQDAAWVLPPRWVDLILIETMARLSSRHQNERMSKFYQTIAKAIRQKSGL